jgi:hypothetical protein
MILSWHHEASSSQFDFAPGQRSTHALKMRSNDTVDLILCDSIQGARGVGRGGRYG